MDEKTPVLLFSDSVYSKLRLAQFIIPLLGSLYLGLGPIWGLPATEQVTGSITVFSTFLAGLVKFSEGKYDKSEIKYDGDMVVHELVGDDGEPVITYSLELNRDAGEFKNDNSIRFKVTKDPLG